MAAISSSSTSPVVTDWSITDTVQVKFIPTVIPITNPALNEKIEFQLKKIPIATNDSLMNFFSRIRRAFGDPDIFWGASLFIKNQGNLFTHTQNSVPDENLSQFLWRPKKIVLEQESEVYFIVHSIPEELDDHSVYPKPLALPQVSMELRTQMQFFDFRHIEKFFVDDFYYLQSKNSAGSSSPISDDPSDDYPPENQIWSSIKNIYDLAQDRLQNNRVVHCKKLLEGFSSCQISLQFPEFDMQQVKIENLSEVLDASNLRVIPKAAQNIIHSYLDYFPKSSLENPSNLPQLFFKAIRLRFSYAGTRDEEEVMSFFNIRYLNIKLGIGKIAETQGSQNDEHHLRGFLAEFGSNYSNEKSVQELRSLLKNSTIFKALNTFMKKCVTGSRILQYSICTQTEKGIVKERFDLNLSPYTSIRQLYLLMTERRRESGISHLNSYHFSVSLYGYPLNPSSQTISELFSNNTGSFIVRDCPRSWFDCPLD